MRLARRSGDPMALSWAYLAHGVASAFSGAKLGAEFEKLSLARLQEAEDVGAWTSAAYMASGMAQGLVLRDPEVARSLAARSIESARTSGNPDAIAFTEMGSGRVEGLLGDFDAARALFQRAIADYGALRDRRMQLIARSDLAHTLRRAGGLAEAEAESRLTIVEWQSLGNRGAIANQLEAFAFMAAMSGDPERSATLLGAAERLRELGHAGMLPHEQAEYAAGSRPSRTALGEAELARRGPRPRAVDRRGRGVRPVRYRSLPPLGPRPRRRPETNFPYRHEPHIYTRPAWAAHRQALCRDPRRRPDLVDPPLAALVRSAGREAARRARPAGPPAAASSTTSP